MPVRELCPPGVVPKPVLGYPVTDSTGTGMPPQALNVTKSMRHLGRRGGRVLLYWFMKRVAGRLGRAVYRPKVEGLENIPTTGPVMLASNHLAFVDSIVIDRKSVV